MSGALQSFCGQVHNPFGLPEFLKIAVPMACALGASGTGLFHIIKGSFNQRFPLIIDSFSQCSLSSFFFFSSFFFPLLNIFPYYYEFSPG